MNVDIKTDIKDTSFDQVHDSFLQLWPVWPGYPRLSRDRLQDTTITAPFPGRVSRIAIEPGDYVQAGQGLTQLVANDNMRYPCFTPC